MPLFQKFQEEELLVGVWKIDETVGQLLALLDNPSFYEKNLSRFASDTRKSEWLAVRVLLKTLCGTEKEIAYLPSGKPYLADGSARFSISHTSGYAAIVIHPIYDVGVDIEKYGTRVRKIASRFLRLDEKTTVEQGDEICALLLHWSAKETLFKVMGVEGVDFIRHLHILPFVMKEEDGCFEAEEYRTEKQQRYHIRYRIHPKFVLTWTYNDAEK